MEHKLWEYVGKNVELIDIDNEKFTGRVVHFDDDTVNNSNECSIEIKTKDLHFDILESEIKSIKEVELNSESLRLWEYIGKRVKVLATNGKTFEGVVINVDDAFDNESGYDSLNIETDKENDVVYDLNENEIESIEEIE
ncbi:hypothetical protein ACWEYO_10410 [Staphylococcus shinii]|uniref:hypothetical protein n=1 Tax=Staphylococcus shinii TaxID=2912228 RepID=UPI000D1EB851|nr:hypothetical protein [Staphylococcus shinii]PTI62131.1 hypothetical protein BU110_13010 [Staphylococcus shinii]